MLLGGLAAWAGGLGFLGFGRNGVNCTADQDCNPHGSSGDNSTATSYCDPKTNRCRMLTDTLTLSTATIGPLIYAVLVTSALCYGLISFANRHCDTSTATAFWPLQVPVAIVLS